jgi:hypothetical protein
MTTRCGLCRVPLDPRGDSPDFCSESHQRLWHTGARGLPLTEAAALVATRVQLDSSAAAPREFHRLTVELGAAVRQLTAAFAAAARAVAEAVRPLAEAAVRAGLIQQPPVDPMRRALELRRTRNTGPTIHRRPPRRIDPTRSRRR